MRIKRDFPRNYERDEKGAVVPTALLALGRTALKVAAKSERSSAHDLGKCREREHGWTNLTREHVSTNWIRWI